MKKLSKMNIGKYIIHFEKEGSPMESTLTGAIQDYTNARSLRLSPNTMQDYRITYRRMINHFGEQYPVNKITSQQVQAFLQTIPGSRKNKLNAYIAMGSLWTWLVKEGIASEHLMHRVEKPKFTKTVIEPFADEEIRRLLESEGKRPVRDRAMLLVMLDTGMRVSELCGLRTNDISGTMLRVIGKGDKERMLPVSADTWMIVADYLKEPRKGRTKYIFETMAGTQYERTALGHHLRRIGARAGVEGCHPHRFRHTFAINFLRNGGNMYVLQELLGHTTLAMVKTYLRIAERDLVLAHAKASPVVNMNLGRFVKSLPEKSHS